MYWLKKGGFLKFFTGSVAFTFRWLLAVCLVVFLSACESKKSGSNKRDDNTSPPPAEGYQLGGNVIGLVGRIKISNNGEQITVDGSATGITQFKFSSPLPSGTLYDVVVEALPDGQLCDLINSKNYIYRDRNDVLIECANMAEIEIEIDIPNSRSIDELSVLSHFQKIGGNGETALSDSRIKILASKNSFVSLLDESGNVVYLLYVDNLSRQTFTLDASSTALALVMMEPNILKALADRDLPPAYIFDALASHLNTTGFMSSLVDEIHALADNPAGYLGRESGELTLTLERATRELGTYLAQIRFPEELSLVSKNKSGAQTSQKVDVATQAQFHGMQVSFSRDDDQLHFRFYNGFHRAIVWNNSRPTIHQTIRALTENSFSVAAHSDNQNVVTGEFIGPGALGDVTDVLIPDLKSATVTTALDQLFIPSLSYIYGVNTPSQFSVYDCLTQDEQMQFQEAVNDEFITVDLLREKNFYSANSRIVSDARQLFLSGRFLDQVLFDKVFSCNKFGIGSFIENKKVHAKENVRKLLEVLNTIYDMDSLPDTMNLFALSNLNRTTQAISTSQVKSVYTLNNTLQVDISSDSDSVLPGVDHEFSATCSSVITQEVVPCTVSWNMGDGSTYTDRQSVIHRFSQVGNYVIAVDAVDLDGARASAQLKVAVNRPASLARVISPRGRDVLNGQKLHDFGCVVMNAGGTSSASTIFKILNEGNIPLQVTGLTVSAGVFMVDAAKSIPFDIAAKFPIAAGSLAHEQPVNLHFNPIALGDYRADVTLSASDSEASYGEAGLVHTMSVHGSAVEASGSSKWTVKIDNATTEYPVYRKKVCYNDANKELQIRAFSSEGDYPQLSVTFLDFDLNDFSGGDGGYALDDTNGRTGLGFFSDGSSDEANRFWTGTSGKYADTPFSGSADICALSQNSKFVKFEFNAVDKESCANTPANECKNALISGEIEIDDSFNCTD